MKRFSEGWGSRGLLGRHPHVNYALADQAVVSGVSFVTGILLARYLGLEEYGRFTLVWIFILFMSSIQHALISAPMMSIGPKQSDGDAPAYFGSVLLQQVLFSGSLFFITLAGVELAGSVFPAWRLGGLALPLAVALVSVQFQEFLRRYFFTRNRGQRALVNDGVRHVGQIVLLVWIFVRFSETADTATALWVIAATAAVAAAAGALLVERVEVTPAAVRRNLARHWRFSKWMSASALMDWMTSNLFLAVAGGLLGAVAVGALKAAQNLMGVTHVFLLGLENVVPSRATTRFHDGGVRSMTGYLKRITFHGAAATSAVAAVAALAPDFWLGLVFGDEFVGYGGLLRWYAVIYVVTFLMVPLQAGLRAIEQTQLIFRAYFAGALLSLVAVFPLVSGFGLTGVVAGILAVRLMQTLILEQGFGGAVKGFNAHVG